MELQITLRSGAQVAVEVSEYTVGRDPLTGELTRLDWTTPDDAAASLRYVDLSEVAAIVRLSPAIVRPGAEDGMS